MNQAGVPCALFTSTMLALSTVESIICCFRLAGGARHRDPRLRIERLPRLLTGQRKMGLAQVSPKPFTLVSTLRASMRRRTRML